MSPFPNVDIIKSTERLNRPILNDQKKRKVKMLTETSQKESVTPEFSQQPDQVELGGLIKKFRVKHSMNQFDFAKALGVSQGLVSLIEKGKVPVSKKVSSRIEELYRQKEGVQQAEAVG